MACKGGPTSEGLLAVSIRALVRSFARVNSSMASERARIAEGLLTKSVEMKFSEK